MLTGFKKKVGESCLNWIKPIHYGNVPSVVLSSKKLQGIVVSCNQVWVIVKVSYGSWDLLFKVSNHGLALPTGNDILVPKGWNALRWNASDFRKKAKNLLAVSQ